MPDAQVEGEVGILSGHSAPAGSLPASSISALEGTGIPEQLPDAWPLHHVSSHPLLQLHYQHQVVQNLHRLWNQYVILPPKGEEAQPGEEEHLSPWAQAAMAQSPVLESPMNVESSAYFRSPVTESQLPRQENMALRDSQDSFRSKKPGIGVRSSQGKTIVEESLVEGSPDLESAKSLWELEGLLLPRWNLCLEDFRKVLPWA